MKNLCAIFAIFLVVLRPLELLGQSPQDQSAYLCYEMYGTEPFDLNSTEASLLMMEFEDRDCDTNYSDKELRAYTQIDGDEKEKILNQAWDQYCQCTKKNTNSAFYFSPRKMQMRSAAQLDNQLGELKDNMIATELYDILKNFGLVQKMVGFLQRQPDPTGENKKFLDSISECSDGANMGQFIDSVHKDCQVCSQESFSKISQQINKILNQCESHDCPGSGVKSGTKNRPTPKSFGELIALFRQDTSKIVIFREELRPAFQRLVAKIRDGQTTIAQMYYRKAKGLSPEELEEKEAADSLYHDPAFELIKKYTESNMNQSYINILEGTIKQGSINPDNVFQYLTGIKQSAPSIANNLCQSMKVSYKKLCGKIDQNYFTFHDHNAQKNVSRFLMKINPLHQDYSDQVALGHIHQQQLACMPNYLKNEMNQLRSVSHLGRPEKLIAGELEWLFGSQSQAHQNVLKKHLSLFKADPQKEAILKQDKYSKPNSHRCEKAEPKRVATFEDSRQYYQSRQSYQADDGTTYHTQDPFFSPGSGGQYAASSSALPTSSGGGQRPISTDGALPADPIAANGVSSRFNPSNNISPNGQDTAAGSLGSGYQAGALGGFPVVPTGAGINNDVSEPGEDTALANGVDTSLDPTIQSLMSEIQSLRDQQTAYESTIKDLQSKVAKGSADREEMIKKANAESDLENIERQIQSKREELSRAQTSVVNGYGGGGSSVGFADSGASRSVASISSGAAAVGAGGSSGAVSGGAGSAGGTTTSGASLGSTSGADGKGALSQSSGVSAATGPHLLANGLTIEEYRAGVLPINAEILKDKNVLVLDESFQLTPESLKGLDPSKNVLFIRTNEDGQLIRITLKRDGNGSLIFKNGVASLDKQVVKVIDRKRIAVNSAAELRKFDAELKARQKFYATQMGQIIDQALQIYGAN